MSFWGGRKRQDGAGRPAQRENPAAQSERWLHAGWEEVDECRRAGGRSWRSLLCVFIAVLAGLIFNTARVYCWPLQLPEMV